MSLTLIFEAHGTTSDNEAHLSSGWYDVALSPKGEQQSREMGERYRDDHFDAIFCSDLQRAWRSAEIAFCKNKVGKLVTDNDFLKAECKFPIITDARLRECNYGDLTQKPSELVDAEKTKRISVPFPNGESYEETNARMKSFLEDLKRDYDGKRVMVIGHRATQYGIEAYVNGMTVEECLAKPFKWEPGWVYKIK
ncbi:MAG: histidine phosphatase family protein [Candidatus Paceibacterota bacterium]